MRGRPPKPTALKRLQGTLREDRARGIEIPVAELPIEMAECPEHVKGEARKQWHRVVDQLVKYKIVATVDASVLELYCTAYANWKQAQAEWDARGSILEVEDRWGKTTYLKNPAVKICQDERKEVSRLGGMLGLDPSGRVRLKATAEKPPDPGGFGSPLPPVEE